MKISVEQITEWERVLNGARVTVGKDDLGKEPSDKFKSQILIAEHSPIRNLLFDVTWDGIPYWVAMHLRTHHIGFHSGEDDLVFIQTQRTDRTDVDRDKLPQDEPVKLRIVINAHSIINVSRVRLCLLTASKTRHAWNGFIKKLEKDCDMLSWLCQPNCIYRGFCPEGENSCGFCKSENYVAFLNNYRKYCQGNMPP